METITTPQKRPNAAKYFLLGALMILATSLFPIGLIVVPAYLAYAMHRTKPGLIVAYAGLYLALGVMLGWFELLLGGLSLGLSIMLYVAHKRRLSGTVTLMLLAGFSVLLLYGMICLPGILSGEGAFYTVEELMRVSVNELQLMMKQMSTQLNGEQLAVLEQFDRYAAALPELIPLTVVPAMLAIALILALTNLVFLRLFGKKTLPQLQKVPPFATWKIPAYLTGGLTVFLLGSIILEFTNASFADAVTVAVNVLVGLPLAVQGLCTLDFLIARRAKRPTTVRVFAYLVIGLMLPVLGTPLMLLGCMEQLFRYRERVTRLRPPPM